MPQIGSRVVLLACVWPCIALLAVPAAAQTIRGQWDFDAGDLSPTLGQAMQYYDPNSNGQAAAKTQFGTTATFGIANIGGLNASVMKFPAFLADEGIILHTNAPGNAGGDYINQYTVIMDLLFPNASSGNWRAIFQTSRTNNNDADFFVNTANGIGIDNQYAGNFTANTWHRLAVTVDLATLTMAKYIDGAPVGTQALNDSIDGRFSLYSTSTAPDNLLLFTDDSGETKTGYVNSIQFRDYVMSAAQIAALGSPSASGIPHDLPPINIAQWDFNGNLSATAGPSALIAGAAPPAGSPGCTFQTATIGGGQAQVASFTRGTFFTMTHGLPANGGGIKVNQYTLLMDVMFPNIQPSGWGALWQTNVNNDEDGEWYIRYPDYGIGISSNYGGYAPDGVWHRLALVIDGPAGTLTSFINGEQVQQNTGLGIDSRWSLGTQALLFADNDQENAAGYVNSVQIRGYAMSTVELAQLGGPSASGLSIPSAPANLHLVSPNGGEHWQAGSAQTISWTVSQPSGVLRIELYDGDAFRTEIGQAVMADGQFTWQIVPYLGDSTNYRIRISPVLYPTIADTSDGAFSVYGSVASPTTITKLPMLQDYRTDAMSLIWESDAHGGTNAVEFGIDDVSENTITDVDTQELNATHFVHTATIRPLQIETTYKYRVRSGTTTSPVFTFRTAPRPSTPTKVVWFADEQGYDIFRQQVPHMAARDPDLVLVAGDLMNDGSNISQWQDYWFGPLEVANLAQTTPVLFSRGNHDGQSDLAYAYSNLPGNEAWYAFTYGNARFVFLDTNLQSPTQTTWLQQELASAAAQSAQFRVVCLHMPPYTDLWDGGTYNGEPWVRDEWVPLFEQYGVDLVVGGHTHAYLRGSRNNVMYMIIGGAGNVLDTYTTYNWGFFTVKASVHHYGFMQVDRNTLTWNTYNASDSLFDSYQLTSRTPLVPADFDADGDVDGDDLARFRNCAAGPLIQIDQGCAMEDLDADSDVDQSDFGLFQRCLSGTGNRADTSCAG